MSPAPVTTSCEAGAGGMSSAQAVATTRLVRGNVVTAYMAGEAVTIFADSTAQIVSSASEAGIGSSAGSVTTS